MLQRIYLEIIGSGEKLTLVIKDGAVAVPGSGAPWIQGSLPLRYTDSDSDGEVLVTKVAQIEPDDPRFVFAVQDAMPDGVLVAGARIDDKDVSWGNLIATYATRGMD